jgi:putative transcriptional regulator
MSESTRGRLLIAAPSLFDYFRRTVILVLEHTPDGAMGVVLNRRSETRVDEAVPALAELPDADQLVRVGGPVAPQSVVALGDFADPDEAGTDVVGSVGTLDPEGGNASVRRLRVYAGYAGWAPGQLDGELEEGAWIMQEARPDDPFREDDIWSEALRRKGGGYRLLATMPSDPSLN